MNSKDYQKGIGKNGVMGKGSSYTFNGACNKCGVRGHCAAQRPQAITCYHCGQQGHGLAQCPAKDMEMEGRRQGPELQREGLELGRLVQRKGEGKGKGGKGGKGYSWGAQGLWEDEWHVEPDGGADKHFLHSP